METHAVEAELSASRARIRALLIPDPHTGEIEADAFPRSTVMRWLLNPRARKLAMTALSVGAMLASRRAAAAAGVWPVLTQSLGNLIARVRA